ncbi:MAG: metallophosphoesterase [Agitococcus sp.]|nr:metallophosphoesterase [Agitococcus sp.]
MSLVQPLFNGNLDIIGDIHGEYDALCSLLRHLGYDLQGGHPEGRRLVFAGDLGDRGPSSPAVFILIMYLCKIGRAQAVAGNHELNLLMQKPKEGTGWFFSEQASKDIRYMPFDVANEFQKKAFLEFMKELPIALEREDIRVVHAAWEPSAIVALRFVTGRDAGQAHIAWEHEVALDIKQSGLKERYSQEQVQWGSQLSDRASRVPMLPATAEYMLAHQMRNPLRIITSGIERICTLPFFAGGKWRFVERHPWWKNYDEEPAVVCGHFWRRLGSAEPEDANELDLFTDVSPFSWHGKKNNVFCVDYSVGARFREREAKKTVGANTKLAALRWPEKELVFDDGTRQITSQFMA